MQDKGFSSVQEMSAISWFPVQPTKNLVDLMTKSNATSKLAKAIDKRVGRKSITDKTARTTLSHNKLTVTRYKSKQQQASPK